MHSNDLKIIAPDPLVHHAAIFDLLEQEWHGIAAFGFARVHPQSHYDWHTSRIGLIGDQIVTHFGVYDISMRIGTARVRAAGVNLVVTHPAYRGQGLMTHTASAVLEAMRAKYDLSVVCNAIEDYYERFGYVLGWPEVHLVIKTDHLPVEPPDGAIQSCAHEQQATFAALYNRDNATVTGTAVRPTFPRGKHPGGGQAVYWTGADDALNGYALFDIQTETRTLWHDDSAGPVEQRLKALGMLARQHDCVQVRFERLSLRSALARRLCELGCIVESSYLRGGGWMIQITNLHTLFTQLAPELERRLERAGLNQWQGDLLLTSDKEQVSLTIHKGHVQIGPALETAHTLDAGHALAHLVVGTYAPDALLETGRVTVRGDAAWLLPVLFPAQDAQMSNDDL